MICAVKLQQFLVVRDDFAFDPTTGHTYTLNAGSRRLIAWLQEGCLEQELPARLVAEFDVTPQAERRDVDSFMSTMRVLKLL